MSERSRYRLIGDPHITRKFEFGVPLARRGEREESLFKQFEDELSDKGEQLLIVVGDLFEKPGVNLKDLHRAMLLVLAAAKANPDRKVVIMAGNHDISAQQNDPGGFDILSLLNGSLPNLIIAHKPLVIDGIALFPWEWSRCAIDQLEVVRGFGFDVAVGHWDLVSYGDGPNDHLCPAAKLVEMGCKEIKSGHWHLAGEYDVDGITVTCTGSMQPMTHAEDPDGKLYVTLTLAEYGEIDPAVYKDKYVRVVAAPGEEVVPLQDCLGFKIKRSHDETDISDYGEVQIDGFKVADVIAKHMKKHEVPEEVGTFIKERLDVDD